MSNARLISSYEEGLRTLLNVCEMSFGPHGSPVFVQSQNETFKPTKNSFSILKTITSYSDNPLVKATLNFALEHNEEHGDHTLYIVILGLNLYLKLKRDNMCHSNLNEKLKEIESLIENKMKKQNKFHTEFENNFDFLFQMSMSLIRPKLFGYSLSKMESFSRFIAAATLQSISDQMCPTTWLEPLVITLPVVTTDPYKYGEIFEGVLIPLNSKSRLKNYLQRVVELRSFIKYELLYKEKRNLNSILMIYDSSKIGNIVTDQMEINEKNHLPSIKQVIVDTFESDFIGLLEKSNVGLVIVQNEMSGNLKSKLSDRSIFLLDNVSEGLISRISKAYNVEIVTSIQIEDMESFVFQVETPNMRQYRTGTFLAIAKPKVITLIFYKLLDSNSTINEDLSHLLFKLLSKRLFEGEPKSLTSVCHGGGCTEFLLAGEILRTGYSDMSANFWMPVLNHSQSSRTLSAIAESFIRIYELLRDPLSDSENCKTSDNLLEMCQNNFTCQCGTIRNSSDGRNTNSLDITSIKVAAIKNALKLVRLLISSDLVILTKSP